MLDLLAPLKRPRARAHALTVYCDGTAVPVTVRRSARAKRYTLRLAVATGEAVLTMPSRGNLAIAQDFAERHAAWLGERLRRLPHVVRFVPGAIVPIEGVPHRLVPGDRLRGGVERRVGLDGMPELVIPGDPAAFRRRVSEHLRHRAREALVAASRRHAAALGVTLGRIVLRDTRSRWGSCSARGDLSFSWRLILAPPFVLDYLAAHEVAHRVQMNHSAHYWRIVARLDPDYERAEAWLTRHSAELHRYG